MSRFTRSTKQSMSHKTKIDKTTVYVLGSPRWGGMVPLERCFGSLYGAITKSKKLSVKFNAEIEVGRIREGIDTVIWPTVARISKKGKVTKYRAG